MQMENVPLDEAVGAILVHNIADAQGHKLFAKGHALSAEDIEKLRGVRHELYVARLAPGEVRENEAVQRIARALGGENVSFSPPNTGRMNALATVRGVFQVNAEMLNRVNGIAGITLATIPAHRVVEAKKMVATYKTIGLALLESSLQELEALGRESGPILTVRPLRAMQVVVILTGSGEAQKRVHETFTHPIQSRVEELGGRVISLHYVPEEPAAIAGAITQATQSGAQCIILAGETSIMDRDDITPRGIEAAGGVVELYGAPVEPGNLLLLAYHGTIPIIGAPGCIKSRDTNVVDLILPRLLTGECIARADVIALANGGLLL
ncbi:MAG: molybdopterin-binding protein [Anaerolineae bacterium]